MEENAVCGQCMVSSAALCCRRVRIKTLDIITGSRGGRPELRTERFEWSAEHAKRTEIEAEV